MRAAAARGKLNKRSSYSEEDFVTVTGPPGSLVWGDKFAFEEASKQYDAAKYDAIIDLGYNQFMVFEGKTYSCRALKGALPGSQVIFPRVISTKTKDGKISWGRPYIEEAQVEARVLENYKDSDAVG